jgi:protein TonB
MTSAAAAAGTATRPGDSIGQSGFAAGQAPRLSAAVAVVVALHVALLTFRPGVSGASRPASAAPVMAIRVVHAARPALAPLAAATAEPSSVLPPTPTVAVAEPTPAPAPSTRNGAETNDARPRDDARAGAVPGAAAVPSNADLAPVQRSLAAAPDYALGATLNPGPRPLDEIEPEYPDIHLREGVVVLRLLIGTNGHVDDVAVVRSAPEGVFEQAALDAFVKARFSPGLAAGTPVKSQITVEVNFMPINRGSRISGRTY